MVVVQAMDDAVRAHRQAGSRGAGAADQIVQCTVIEEPVVRGIVGQDEQRMLLRRHDDNGGECHRPRPEGHGDSGGDPYDQPGLQHRCRRTPVRDAGQRIEVRAGQPARRALCRSEVCGRTSRRQAPISRGTPRPTGRDPVGACRLVHSWCGRYSVHGQGHAAPARAVAQLCQKGGALGSPRVNRGCRSRSN